MRTEKSSKAEALIKKKYAHVIGYYLICCLIGLDVEIRAMGEEVHRIRLMCARAVVDNECTLTSIQHTCSIFHLR